MKKLLVLFLLFPAFVKCENLDSLQKKFQGAKVSQVFLIAATPTEASKQDPHKNYLNDYEVWQTSKVKSSDKKKLMKALQDSQNFSQQATKRCPFQGKYGLKLDNSLTLIISGAPCSKVLIFSEGTEESYDLSPKNEIETALLKVASP